MRTSGAVKYPKFEVIPGGQSPFRGRRRGRRTRTAAELVLDRDLRTDFAALVDRQGNVPSEAIQKVRIAEQHPWRVLARRIVEAHAAGAEHQRVRQIGVRLVQWIDRLYQTGVGETVTERVFYQSPRRVA